MQASDEFLRFHPMIEGIVAERFREHALRCFQVFAGLFRCSLASLPKPALYLFDTPASFKEHLRQNGIDAAPLARFSGMFWVEAEGPAIGACKGDALPLELHRTLQHEIYHYFEAMTTGGAMPPWLSEGLAQYHEEAILAEKGILTGQIPPQKVESLQIFAQSRSLMPLVSLLFASQDDVNGWLRLDPGQCSRFYSQSWALVAYLSARHPGFSPMRFAELVTKEGRHPLFVFSEMVGQDLPEFEEAWHAWIAALEPDPASQALDRLVLIAAWMILLSSEMNLHHLPTLEKLRVAAGQYPWLKVTANGRKFLPFSSPDLYRYHVGDPRECREFEIVPSGDRDVPPSLRASDLPGLDGGRITLHWEVNSARMFIPDFTIEPGAG